MALNFVWQRHGLNFLFISVRDVDFEVIVVDDGSPDGTQDIVKQLQLVYGEDRIVSELDYILITWISSEAVRVNTYDCTIPEFFTSSLVYLRHATCPFSL